MSENSYPLNVVNTFFLEYSGIPESYLALRFFDGPIFGYFFYNSSLQHYLEPIPTICYFIFNVIFIVIASTTPLSLRFLFYNSFISFKSNKLGGATKMFAPTITTTRTESTTISLTIENTTTESITIGLTTEIDVHIQQQKMHKKTKENTQNLSVCFPAFLFCHITMWCLRGVYA